MATPHRPQTVDAYRERLLPVLVHIQEHLDDEMDLPSLARLAHFSPFHFHRVFRGMTGEGVAEHVRRLRLERAAQRLKYGDRAVVDIALEAGYEAHEAFTRAFRAVFDQSPSEFRVSHRPQPMAAHAAGVHYSPTGEFRAAVDHFNPIQEGARTMNVRIEQMKPCRVAYIRHVGPYNEVGPVWGRLFSWAGPRGLIGPRMNAFGLCYDDPDVTPADKIRYEACLAIERPVEPQGEIGVQEVAGGEFAVTVHKGPYQTLGQAYATLMGQWLPASGREPGPPPSIERYLNDPRGTPPEELLTEIWLRLA